MQTKIRKHIVFYGRVQGVGFRYYAVNKANQLGLTGWVKNLPDGTVEMEVQGEEPLIDQLIIFLQNRTYIWIEKLDARSIPLRMILHFRNDIDPMRQNSENFVLSKNFLKILLRCADWRNIIVIHKILQHIRRNERWQCWTEVDILDAKVQQCQKNTYRFLLVPG